MSGTLTLENKEETALSLSIGEKLYPVRFVFLSSQVQDTDQVKLRAKRTDAAGTGNPVELSKELGQFAFDGKLVKMLQMKIVQLQRHIFRQANISLKLRRE